MSWAHDVCADASRYSSAAWPVNLGGNGMDGMEPLLSIHTYSQSPIIIMLHHMSTKSSNCWSNGWHFLCSRDAQWRWRINEMEFSSWQILTRFIRNVNHNYSTLWTKSQQIGQIVVKQKSMFSLIFTIIEKKIANCLHINRGVRY